MIPYRYIERSKYHFVRISGWSFYCSYLAVFTCKFFIKDYLTEFFFQNKYTTTICKNTLGIGIKREKNMSILCEGMLGRGGGGS